MTALNLSQVIRELQGIDADIRARADMPAHMDILIPCRAAMDLSSMRFDLVKVNARLGDCVLFHFFREDN